MDSEWQSTESSLEGQPARDVEMRATASGLAVAGFTVAVNEKRKNAEGEYVDAPVFVKCSLFGTRAEKLSKYLLKGTKVIIDGKLRYSQWTKDDEKRHELSVIVDQLEFSGGKREQTGDASAPQCEPSHAVPARFPNSTSMTRTSRSRSGREARHGRGGLGLPDAGGRARGLRHRPRRRVHLREEGRSTAHGCC